MLFRSADWFVARGVRPQQLTVTGQSDQAPIGDNGTASGRNKNRRVEMAFVMPKLYRVELHGRWRAQKDSNTEILQSEKVDADDLGARATEKEVIEIKQLMSGSYPEHATFQLGAGERSEAYVTAQAFGVDSLGTPMSEALSWEELGSGAVMDVWGADHRSGTALGRAQSEAPVAARWAPAC